MGESFRSGNRNFTQGRGRGCELVFGGVLQPPVQDGQDFLGTAARGTDQKNPAKPLFVAAVPFYELLPDATGKGNPGLFVPGHRRLVPGA